MLGVWVNFAGVVAGGLLGTLLRGGIPRKYQTALNQVLALCVLVIGVSGAIETSNVLIVIISAVVGTFVGELLRIERGLDRLGDALPGLAEAHGDVSVASDVCGHLGKVRTLVVSPKENDDVAGLEGGERLGDRIGVRGL